MRTGQCMCGAVRFAASEVPDTFGACHCEMCRRWTGSAFLGLTVPVASVKWSGEDSIARLQSSDWAERAWCVRCGSPLYYHVTLEGPMSENYELPLGLFNDATGLTFASEIYIDHKPEGFAYAGDRPRLTRKETLAKFGIEDEGVTP